MRREAWVVSLILHAVLSSCKHEDDRQQSKNKKNERKIVVVATPS